MTTSSLERLTAEHAVIAAMMNALEAEITALDSTGAFDIDLVRLILRYMTEYPDAFHHPREELLFRRAVGKDASLADMIQSVRRDHASLPALTATLGETLDAMEIGASMPRGSVLATLRAYVERQREHMGFEEHAIFPVLRTLLTDDDWAAAEAHDAEMEDPLHGGHDPGPYARLRELILAR